VLKTLSTTPIIFSKHRTVYCAGVIFGNFGKNRKKIGGKILHCVFFGVFFKNI
jgi:hypothetical protein